MSFRAIRSTAALVVISALATLLLAVAARGATNTKLSGAFAFTDTTSCLDPIRVAESYAEQMHTYDDQNGNLIRLQFTGTVKITYTDLATGSTYSPNSSGPATVDLATGQTTLRGGNGALFDPSGVLIATDGRVVLDAGGNVVSLRGDVRGVCAQLGSA